MNEKPKTPLTPAKTQPGRSVISTLGKVRRVLFLLACVVTMIALFYAEEDWRGWHDWNQFRQEWAAKGERFDWASAVPPAVPDDQNFAMAPVVVTSYGMSLDRDGNQIRPANTNLIDRLKMDYLYGAKDTPADVRGDWALGVKTDLASWQRFYRTRAATANLLPGPEGSQSPAAAVLAALSRFAPTIEELREAARRPDSRFPLNYGTEDPADLLLPHLTGIKRAGEVVQLRALAELQAGDAGGALADTLLVERLADSVRNEPMLISHLIRMVLLRRMLQPVWEGLADRRWTDGQLTALDAGLASFDLLAEYKTALHGELAMRCGLIDYLRRHPEEYGAMTGTDGDSSSGQLATRMLMGWHLFPSGWIYQNLLLTARTMEEDYRPIVDEEARTFATTFPGQKLGTAAARRERLTPDNVIAREFDISWGSVVQRFAFAQSSVDMAHVAIALERYRRATGKYPDGLAALEPQFLNSVPQDVIGGKPLGYRLMNDGQFVLYSVGWNGIDDGGVVVLKKGADRVQDMSQGDWVWSYGER